MRLSVAFVLAALSAISVADSAGDGGYSYFAGTDSQDAHDTDPAAKLSYTLASGNPYPNPYMFDRLGTNGPVLIQATNLIEQLAHFVRERVPERTVHAKGAGAHGYFEVTTTTAAKYTIADMFQKVGQRTPLTARLSTIAGNLGSPDTVRDLRGLGFKMRTQEGIYDLVMLNHPVFWLRDPTKFPHFIRSQKRDPSTNVVNYNNFWDYLSANKESVLQVMRTFTDLGTPYGYRHMPGYSGNTFRLVKSDTEWYYAKILVLPDAGIRNNTLEQSINATALQYDFGNTDLYNTIASGQTVSWTAYFQIMTPKQAEQYKWNPLDLTKEWLQEDIPYQEVGKIVLNQNVANHHAEVEQIGFNPGNMPPGIEPSEDPTLQARLFAYADAQRYRTGVNSYQLPINCPLNPVANFLRDGAMAFNNQGSRPNFASTQDQLKLTPRAYNDDNHTIWVGGAVKYLSQPSEADFEQPRIFWNKLSQTDKDHLVHNILWHLGQATDMRIKKQQVAIFNHVNSTFGGLVAKGLNITL